MASHPPSLPGRRVRCFTRAIKNARYLQQHDPATFDKDKNADGFGTGVPMEILHVLHRLRHDSPELQSHPSVSEFLRNRPVPGPERWQR
jgi:hypothetical protein